MFNQEILPIKGKKNTLKMCRFEAQRVDPNMLKRPNGPKQIY